MKRLKLLLLILALLVSISGFSNPPKKTYRTKQQYMKSWKKKLKPYRRYSRHCKMYWTNRVQPIKPSIL